MLDADILAEAGEQLAASRERIAELKKELLELYREKVAWARPYERKWFDKRIDELEKGLHD